MIVHLKPVSGTAKENLDRAKVEIERVVGFRVIVIEAEVQRGLIAVTFEVNPKWDLPEEERISYLKEWIPAKVKKVFEVISVSE
jgi:hypothetical protein